MREVGCVIFDEVHYMRDRERGVVWEESIVLLSPEIQCVFLSATLSNANDFANWCAHLKQRACHVVRRQVFRAASGLETEINVRIVYNFHRMYSFDVGMHIFYQTLRKDSLYITSQNQKWAAKFKAQ